MFAGSLASAWEVKLGDRTMNIFNYIQTRYCFSPAGTDQFSVPRLRTDFSGDIGKLAGYFIEVDYVTTPALVYGWANVKLPFGKLSMGRFYEPFGLEYTTPPSNFDTINPTNMLWYYFGYSRDIGIELSNNLGFMKYGVAIVNGADNKFVDDNRAKDLVGRFVFMPNSNLAYGFSGYTGKTGTMEMEKSLAGAEISYNCSIGSLKGEIIGGKMNGANSFGWYLQPLIGIKTPLQLLLRYESWDPNTAIAGDLTGTLTLGVNYFFDEGSKLQINYENKAEETPIDNNALLVQLQVNF